MRHGCIYIHFYLHHSLFQASESTGTGVQTGRINVWGWQAMWFNKRLNLDGSGNYHLVVRDIQYWINTAVGRLRMPRASCLHALYRNKNK